MTQDRIVKMRDIRAAKMCSSGARHFFERYELDWTDFLKNGVPLQKLLDTNDGLAKMLAERLNCGQQ